LKTTEVVQRRNIKRFYRPMKKQSLCILSFGGVKNRISSYIIENFVKKERELFESISK
jgi:hypothetical protein